MWRGGWVDGGVVARLCAGGSFRWQCWSCSACLRLFVVVVWLVFVGGLGGIATIGAALRRVVGVSVVYGRKTPRVVARKGQRRVPVEGSMVAKSPAWLLGRARAACSLGGCVGRVRHVFVCLSWLVFVGGLGGIATIGAALRRVAGVSGVYGRKTPRVVAHSAVHLGGMRVEWGVWGVVDYGLGVVVGLMGEWWLGFALVAGGMSLVLVWCGSSSLVAWGELLP